MNKQKMLFGIVSVLLCCLMVCGCTQQAPTSKMPIHDILAKAKSVVSVKYDLITTIMEGNHTVNRTQTIWEKPPYMKSNASLGSGYEVFIKRPDGIYTSNNETHKFIKINGSFNEKSLINQSDALLSNMTFRIVGNETIDGVATTVLQYSMNESGGSTTTKVWIWNDKGIPIKTQVTVHMGKMTFVTTMVMKNFDFSDIPISEFSVE